MTKGINTELSVCVVMSAGVDGAAYHAAYNDDFSRCQAVPGHNDGNGAAYHAACSDDFSRCRMVPVRPTMPHVVTTLVVAGRYPVMTMVVGMSAISTTEGVTTPIPTPSVVAATLRSAPFQSSHPTPKLPTG